MHAMTPPSCHAPIALWMPPGPGSVDGHAGALTAQLRSLGADVATGSTPPAHVDAALRAAGARGFDPARLCHHHRERWPAMPLLLLGRFPTEADRIVALESGADDCLGPECSPRELLARVRALRRRLAAAHGRGDTRAGVVDPADRPAPAVRVGAWLYCRAQRSLTDGQRHAGLSSVEVGLLDALTATPGRAVDRRALLHRWVREGQSVTLRAVDTAVMRLRRRVEPEPARPRWILTVRGQGYCYVPADAG